MTQLSLQARPSSLTLNITEFTFLKPSYLILGGGGEQICGTHNFILIVAVMMVSRIF